MGIDPSLKWALGKSDDYTWFFTLNYTEILEFEPAHDPNHHHKGDPGAWSAHALEHVWRPKAVGKFDGLDLANQGFWGWPEGGHLF